MASRYEVLLRRGNGMNKTVIIEDCMSEQEARETAESMYGMEALRVIWKGSTSSYTSSSSSSHSSSSYSSSDSNSELSGEDIMYGMIGIAAIFAIFIVISLWPLFLTGAICWAIWKWWKKRGSDDNESN